jgi:hypothetical protein
MQDIEAQMAEVASRLATRHTPSPSKGMLDSVVNVNSRIAPSMIVEKMSLTQSSLNLVGKQIVNRIQRLCLGLFNFASKLRHKQDETNQTKFFFVVE